MCKSIEIWENNDIKDSFNTTLKVSASQWMDTKTIIAIISYISINAELHEWDLDSVMPDPEEKIFNRFSKYCEEIKNEIIEASSYAIAQQSAEEVIGLDVITVWKITAYLKRESRRKLRESSNDPMTALDSLTDYFEKILEKQDNSNFDRNAIRYYLIWEIIKCNVFPND